MFYFVYLSDSLVTGGVRMWGGGDNKLNKKYLRSPCQIKCLKRSVAVADVYVDSVQHLISGKNSMYINGTYIKHF